MRCHLQRRCCRHPTGLGYGWGDGRWITLLAWDPALSLHSLVQHTRSQAVVSWYLSVGTTCCPYPRTRGQHSGSCLCVSITRSGNLNICGTSSLSFCSSVPVPPSLHLCLSSSGLSFLSFLVSACFQISLVLCLPISESFSSQALCFFPFFWGLCLPSQFLFPSPGLPVETASWPHPLVVQTMGCR